METRSSSSKTTSKRKRELDEYQDDNSQNSDDDDVKILRVYKRARYDDEKVEIGLSSSAINHESQTDRLDRINRRITDHYNRHKQPAGLFAWKMNVLSELSDLLRNIFNHPFHLIPVGSTVSGFGSSQSDMDLCLIIYDRLPSGEDILKDSIRDALSALYKTCHGLRRLRAGMIRNAQVIRAKVPIVQFVYRKNGRECGVDINCNNLPGIRNSHLLHYYGGLDERLPYLVSVIKAWARSADVNDAKEGTLSSYAWVLMIIHYLQYGVKKTHPGSEEVLPNLQRSLPHVFRHDSDVRQLALFDQLNLQPSTTRNPLSTGELLLGFFEYYARMFDYSKYAVSVRTSGVVRKKELLFTISKNKFICVEEPFERTNVARAVFNEAKFNKVVDAIREAYENLKRYLTLESIGIE